MMDLSYHFGIGKQRRMMSAAKFFAVVLAAGSTFLTDSHFASAASRDIEPALVKGLVVQGLRGEVNVVIGTEPEVKVMIEGDGEALDAVDTEVKNEALRVTIPNSSTNIAAVDGNVTVITSGGGSSHVQIGSQTFNSESEATELDMKVTMPKGTILRLEGFVGDADIGDTGADVVLSCASCDVSLGEIAALDVSLTGSGGVSAKRVDRALVAKISGDGHIDIADGELTQANLAIVGGGKIGFGGRTTDAKVRIVGTGDVHIREVENPIQSSIVGTGDIVTGR